MVGSDSQTNVTPGLFQLFVLLGAPGVAGYTIEGTLVSPSSSPYYEANFTLATVSAASSFPDFTFPATLPPLSAYTTARMQAGFSPNNIISNVNLDSISSSCSPAATSPVPSIAPGGLSPNSAIAGSPAFTLTVDGAGFVNGSVIEWNGTAVTTTFVGATQLSATIPASLIASPGSASVTVLNPGGVLSNAVTFTLTPAAAGPAITSVSPSFVRGEAHRSPLRFPGPV